MSNTVGYMRRDFDAQTLELALRHMKCGDRHHRIRRSVHQKHRRLGEVMMAKPDRSGEHSRIADHGGHRSGSAQPDMKRHHRALAEAHQGQIRLGQIILRQLAVDKCVYRGSSRSRACGSALERHPPLSRTITLNCRKKLVLIGVPIGAARDPGTCQYRITINVLASVRTGLHSNADPQPAGFGRRRSHN